MSFGTAAIQAIYGLSSLSSIVLAYVVWQHRHQPAARPLLAAIVFGWWWSTGLFLATVVPDPALSSLLARSVYVGVVGGVASIVVFALEYTGREHLVTPRALAVLAVEPALVIVAVFLNPGDAFFTAVAADPTAVIGVDFGYGWAFLLHTVYSYALTLAVGAMILDLAYRTKALYRGQLAALLGAVFVPLLVNAVAIARVVDFDITPLGIVIANALYTLAITRYRLIDLAPIARDRVVNNVHDGMFVVDTDDRIVDVNPAGEALAERFVDDADVVGESARDLLELVPEMGDLYDDIVAGDGDRSVEYAIGGGHFQAEATPIEDARDRRVGWLFLVRDITERKRREEALRERNEQLDEFASVVSHDLRNPLQVAAGRVEIARETGNVSHLEAAEGALDRMEDIIDDVLSLARSGDGVTDLEPLELAGVAEAAWENVETTGAALHVPSGVRVTADHERLVRLLENLFRNAIEHGSGAEDDGVASAGVAGTDREDGRAVVTDLGPGGGEGADDGGWIGPPDGASVAVTVEVGVIQGEDGSTGFYVSDDGPGIPPEDREAVFESSYSTNPEGTGFGLTIVSQIAEAHGWSVGTTESEAGGARFEITGVELVGR